MDSYSRTVRLLKVILPLAALGLLSTVFLLSRGVDTTTTIPFAEHDIKARIGDQQVTAPYFSGTTSGGDEVILTAAVARPGGDGRPAEAEKLLARVTMTGGQRITLTSEAGMVDFAAQLATFIGKVQISTTTGYEILSERLETELSGLAARSPGQISGTGPIGTFTAGSMMMESKIEGGAIHTLFKNGVKLVYDPKQPER